jgi:predicted ribosome quality control (RQC) complex YloA/Tae2 family protein
LNPEAKLIVGRTQKDNEKILKYHNPEEDIVITVNKYAGPTAVIPRGAEKDAIFLAASICTGYSKAPNFAAVDVQITKPKGKEVLKVIGIPPEDVRKLLIT